MPKLAILIAASANPAFYSQIAAIGIALRKLRWQRWQPTVYAFFGEIGESTFGDFSRWLPYLHDVEITFVSQSQYAALGNWAQCDANIRHAPRDADVIMALDADTLPVADFEDVLDRVFADNLIAGVMAHSAFPSDVSPRHDWDTAAAALIHKPLQFDHTYSLVGPEVPLEQRLTPFYVNGGVVFYSRSTFAAFAPRYLTLREKLMERMSATDFSAQAAFTLAIAEQGFRTWELPMRYNFPNDPRAELLQADEMGKVVIHHYQHRGRFDRHRILSTAQAYAEFLAMPLEGINRQFQDSVRSVLGESYPFP